MRPPTAVPCCCPLRARADPPPPSGGLRTGARPDTVSSSFGVALRVARPAARCVASRVAAPVKSHRMYEWHRPATRGPPESLAGIGPGASRGPKSGRCRRRKGWRPPRQPLAPPSRSRSRSPWACISCGDVCRIACRICLDAERLLAPPSRSRSRSPGRRRRGGGGATVERRRCGVVAKRYKLERHQGAEAERRRRRGGGAAELRAAAALRTSCGAAAGRVRSGCRAAAAQLQSGCRERRRCGSGCGATVECGGGAAAERL